MSHYSVAVIHKDNQYVEDLLAPYDENIKVAKYLEFTKEQAVKYARKHYMNINDSIPDDEVWKHFSMDYPDDMKDEDGNLYSTYNPNSKWDWYLIGGRWSGSLKLKEPENDWEYVDSAKIKDIDFSPDEEEYEEALEYWDTYIDHKASSTNEDYKPIFKESYYKHRYKKRETYAKYRASFHTRAVITPDGVWHEQGKMGWFGCSSESDEEALDWADNYLERFINHADPELNITIVDCHI